jgi:hypothetical protein
MHTTTKSCVHAQQRSEEEATMSSKEQSRRSTASKTDAPRNLSTHREKMSNMRTYRDLGVMLLLAAFALSPMEAGAVGSKGSKERRRDTGTVVQPLIVGIGDLKDITGCDFSPIVGAMRIISCNNFGALPSAGFEVNDEVISINRKPVTDILSLTQAVKDAHATPQPDEVVVRDHRTLQIFTLNVVL